MPSMNQPCIVITGACGGIGKGLCKVFHEAGYHVIASGRRAPCEDLLYGSFVAADLQKTVLDEAYGAEVFAAIQDAVGDGQLKALVNNAATQILAPVTALTRAQWHNTLDINLLAPFFWTQALLPALQAAKGCVINMSSIHARLTKTRFAAYAASKGALSTLTRVMALELGDLGVRVNAIEPAAIDTPMLQDGFKDNPEAYARLKKFHPSRCIGTAEELGQLVKMVVEAGSGFLHGAVIPFDGGISGVLSDPDNSPR